MNRVFGYARSSTDEQIDTIMAQIERCKAEYAHRFASEGYVWGGEYTDQGVSGSKGFRNRPAGHNLHCEAGKGDVIIITKLDRGFRNTADFFAVVEVWAKKGVRLVMLDLNLDTGTPVGRLMAGMLALFAEFERARAGERTADVLRARRAKGLPIAGQTAYGFKCVGKKGQRRLRPDPYTRAIGKKIVEWIDGGWSYDTIYFHLLTNKIKTRLQKEWSRTSITRADQGERVLAALEAEGLSQDEIVKRIMQPRPTTNPKGDSLAQE